MNDYGMTIIAGGREIEIPVLPQKLKVTSPGNNDKATVLVLGDILILRKKGLRTVAWDSFFPVNDAPFVTGRITDPVEIVRAIQDARDGLDPVRFLITGPQHSPRRRPPGPRKQGQSWTSCHISIVRPGRSGSKQV